MWLQHSLAQASQVAADRLALQHKVVAPWALQHKVVAPWVLTEEAEIVSKRSGGPYPLLYKNTRTKTAT